MIVMIMGATVIMIYVVSKFIIMLRIVCFLGNSYVTLVIYISILFNFCMLIDNYGGGGACSKDNFWVYS